MVVIFNSSPLINLSKIDCLNLIPKLYKQIIIPEAVYREAILQGEKKKGHEKIKKLFNEKKISVRSIENIELVKSLKKDLDDGESEVIVLGLQLNADLVVIDESDARQIADLYNLNKTGFIGILIKAKQKGHINSVKRYLDAAIESGFRINAKLYKVIIEKTGEIG